MGATIALAALFLFIYIIWVIADLLDPNRDVKKKNNSTLGARRMREVDSGSKKGKFASEITNQQREKLEKLRKLQQERQNAVIGKASAEKPMYDHQTSDCGGGSIHDGYHEGSVRRPAQASSAEGRLGRQGVYAKEGQNAASASPAKEQPAYNVRPDAEHSAETARGISGPEKLASAISGKPAIVQGLIWAEVLGKPLSDS